jgi:hypothetical protein
VKCLNVAFEGTFGGGTKDIQYGRGRGRVEKRIFRLALHKHPEDQSEILMSCG